MTRIKTITKHFRVIVYTLGVNTHVLFK